MLIADDPFGLQCPWLKNDIDGFLARPTKRVIATVRQLEGPVLVLGAGGKMGFNLCLMLRNAANIAGVGLRVIAVSRFRSESDLRSFSDATIETVQCDLSDPSDVRKLPDAPTVFFLAGIKFGTASSPQLLEQMNIRMPRLVADRYRGSRIVAFSTGCVYPFMTFESGGATEAMAPAPVGDYASSCLQRENAFAEVAERAGTPVVIIRLNYSVEPRYGVLVDIASKVRRGSPIDINTGFVNVIWQTDALAHIIQSVSIAADPAVPLNIAGAGIHRVRDIAERFGKLFELAPIVEGQEQQTAWLNNASHSHQLFGLPPTPLERMVEWTFAWLSRGGETLGKPTAFEKRDGQY